MEIQDRANKYASGKTNEIMIQAIAQAYMDGYQNGYKDCEKEIPAEFQKYMTEFVDLGLPSGTLWAADYERINGNESIVYLPYDKASSLNIPTKEQWEELFDICRWDFKYVSEKTTYFICNGPNGNCIKFSCYGSIQNEKNLTNYTNALFWIRDESENLEKNAVCMYNQRQYVVKMYKGYRLPVRLVRQ